VAQEIFEGKLTLEIESNHPLVSEIEKYILTKKIKPIRCIIFDNWYKYTASERSVKDRQKLFSSTTLFMCCDKQLINICNGVEEGDFVGKGVRFIK